MGFIDRGWKRVLVSLALGGVAAEIVNVLTGNDSNSNLITGFVFVIVFILTTVIESIYNEKKNRINSEDEELIDQ